jgi:hypothetical protein
MTFSSVCCYRDWVTSSTVFHPLCFSLQKIATVGFVGCIRNFKINGNLFGPPSRSFGTRPCYPNVEIGAFFGAAGGYLVVRKY